MTVIEWRDLPFIDELEAVVEAPRAAVYLAVARRLARGLEGPGARAFSALDLVS